jgi:hypothetical protein
MQSGSVTLVRVLTHDRFCLVSSASHRSDSVRMLTFAGPLCRIALPTTRRLIGVSLHQVNASSAAEPDVVVCTLFATGEVGVFGASDGALRYVWN